MSTSYESHHWAPQPTPLLHPLLPLRLTALTLDQSPPPQITSPTSLLYLVVSCDTFENMRAYLLFNHSFPDAATLPAVIRGCLVSAAIESQDPQALDIHQWLNRDNAYIDKLSHLVRSLYYQLSLPTDIVLAATCSHPHLPL